MLFVELFVVISGGANIKIATARALAAIFKIIVFVIIWTNNIIVGTFAVWIMYTSFAGSIITILLH